MKGASSTTNSMPSLLRANRKCDIDVSAVWRRSLISLISRGSEKSKCGSLRSKLIQHQMPATRALFQRRYADPPGVVTNRAFGDPDEQDDFVAMFGHARVEGTVDLEAGAAWPDHVRGDDRIGG